jgi:hypothetical protein
MSKSETIGVFYTLCCISRGRASEKQPGQLFEPATATERDELLAMEAIRPVTEEELALYEKVNAKKVSSTEAADKAAAAAAADKAAAEAAAKTGKTGSTATDKLVG